MENFNKLGHQDTKLEKKNSINIFQSLEEQREYYLSESAKRSAIENFRIAHVLIKKIYPINPDAKLIRKIKMK